MGNAIVYVMVQRTYKKIYMSRFVLEIFLRILFLGGKRRFIKNIVGKFCILRGKRHFIEKIEEKFCFLGEK